MIRDKGKGISCRKNKNNETKSIPWKGNKNNKAKAFPRGERTRVNEVAKMVVGTTSKFC